MDFDYALKVGALVVGMVGALYVAYRLGKLIYMVASNSSTPPADPRHRESVQGAPETTVADIHLTPRTDVNEQRRRWA
jgi:hypothetical protein